MYLAVSRLKTKLIVFSKILCLIDNLCPPSIPDPFHQASPIAVC
jgi:hypothetical protein